MVIHRAKITKIRASRVVVEFEDGSEAWLPGQELSSRYVPSIELSKQNLCEVGEELDVMTYGTEVGGETRLVSHIRIQNDPWDKVKSWRRGTLKEMEVLSVTQTIAFGRIEPGIEGYVDLSELYAQIPFPRTWHNFKAVVPRDTLAGYVDVTCINHEDRLVKLDVASYIKSLEGESEFLGSSMSAEVLVEEAPQPQNQIEPSDGLLPGPVHALVVDDHRILLDGLSSYLTEVGVEVSQAGSKTEAEDLLSHPRCPDLDLAIIDIHLTENFEYSGLEVAKAVEQQQPYCQILLMTADQEALFSRVALNKMIAIAGEVRICGFLYKPFGSEDLRRAISEAGSKKSLRLGDLLSPNTKGDTLSSKHKEPDGENALNAALRELKKAIRAEAVVLFSIHPLTYEVDFVATAASPAKLSGLHDLQSKLRYSPVRDVAIEREIIHEKVISGTKSYPKHRWLNKAIKYESCIAYPVSVVSEFAYCLFAFDARRGKFDDTDRHMTRASAGEIARILEIQRLVEIKKGDSPFLVAGKTYGSMAHELVTALPNEFKINEIERILKRAAEDGLEEMHALERELRKMIPNLKRAIEIVKTFRRMAKGQHETETEVDVHRVIIDVVEALKPEIKACNTEVAVRTVGSKLSTKAKMRWAAFEQVVVNLILNAAQQIKRFSFARQKGSINIEISHLKRADKSWLRVLFHDSGPGIHTRDFAEVFKMGFTTKEDGLGMGLDISRDIVLHAKGSVRIKKSILFVGTTFELLLPLKMDLDV